MTSLGEPDADVAVANVVVTSQSPSGLRVLLLHPSDVDTNDGDWAWVPPGGQREQDEDAAACARRELEEETGISKRSPIRSTSRRRRSKSATSWCL